MNYYIEESIGLFREDLRMTESSPKNKGLQNIDESYTRLEKKDADILHSIVSKIICVAKRGRSVIEPDISFLCTRGTSSIKEDKDKLRRVL